MNPSEERRTALAGGRRRLLALQLRPEHQLLIALEARLSGPAQEPLRDAVRWALAELLEQWSFVVATDQELTDVQRQHLRSLASELALDAHLRRPVPPPRREGGPRLRVVPGGGRG